MLVDFVSQRISALILAGGPSRRMGRDKSWLTLDGTPLVEYVARRILPLADELIISSNSPERLDPFLAALSIPARAVADQAPSQGPLSGISAGLQVARHDLVLVLAVDMPFVQLGLLRYMAGLAGAYQAVVPQVPDPRSRRLRPEPLHAFYRRSCLAPISERLARQSRRVVSFLPDVRTRWVLPDEISQFDPSFISFRNLNTPSDWDSAFRHPSRP
jgi:molybdopterin-guanine dinucleotide biosynthesis protein A